MLIIRPLTRVESESIDKSSCSALLADPGTSGEVEGEEEDGEDYSREISFHKRERKNSCRKKGNSPFFLIQGGRGTAPSS